MCAADQHDKPWGYYSIISESDEYKVKLIVVNPGKRLSLQRHIHRSEHWYILSGTALATLNKKIFQLRTGDSIDIAKNDVHRIENTGTDHVRFIEIQSGDYFGEDDIERLEDDFGRV